MDGGWHNLTMTITNSLLTLWIDGRSITVHSSRLPLSFGRVVYFGQSIQSFTAILVGNTLSFRGCLKNVRMDSQHVTFNHAVRISYSAPLPSPGCSADKCSNSDAISCLNNGQCTGNNSGVYCECFLGYTGNNCEKCKLDCCC